MPTAQHRRFDQGMNQDESSGVLTEGYCYSSKNMLYDKLGITRKRGGVLGVGATTTYGGDELAALLTDAGSVQLYSFGSGGGGRPLASINAATGAVTNIGGANTGALNPDGGRPFNHHGFMIFPAYSISTALQNVSVQAVGGATGSVAQRNFTTPGSVVLTAGDKRIPCAAADNPTTLMQVGQFISVANATNIYVGRVTALISSTAFEVFPTPPISFVATGVSVTNYYTPPLGSFPSSLAFIGGRVGMSYQGRICLGNISRCDFNGANRLEQYPRRFWFTTTLLEQDASGAAGVMSGAVFLTPNGFMPLNYFDIPVQEAITAMSPTGFGDALIFSAFRTFRLTGNLTTQYGTDQSITWSPREIPNSVGCISERSMQRTPRGVVFAHDSGIYATDGSSMRPLMYKKMTDYWKSLQGSLFKIYGSALIRGNHYYVCGVDSAGTPWGLLCNLDTLAWGTITGKTAPASWLINSSVQDPIDTSRVWGLKWWDQSGAVPSMTGGQLVKLESMFTPSSANRVDSDTTTVNFEHVSRPYHEDQPTIQKDWIGATIQYNNKGGGGVGVTPAFVGESEDMPAGGNTTALPKQDVYTVTAGTGAGVIIVLTIGAGHTITADSWVRVTGATGNSNANGLWRVQSVTGTTLTLMGSVGNGVFAGTCTVQNVDERDITLQNAVPIGGNPAAVVYRINDTDLGVGGADEFELLGITHTWEDRDVHVE